MGDTDFSTMESYCLERARLEPLNRGKWIAQAERGTNLRAPRAPGGFRKGRFNSQCTRSRWLRNANRARISERQPALRPVDSVDNHNCCETAWTETRSVLTPRKQRTEDSYDPALFTAWY